MPHGTPQPPAYAARRRRGISLIEVILATVMLLGSVMALSQIAYLARRHATGAEDRTQAQMYCQNILHELLAGLRPLRNVSPEYMEDESWLYSIQIEPVDVAALASATTATLSSQSDPSKAPGLVRITITVDRSDEETASIPSEDTMQGYRLVMWVRGEARSGESWESPPEAGSELPQSGAAEDALLSPPSPARRGSNGREVFP